jgi:oligopeptide/dipeptide ABC transporter ATP-binding protein
MADATPVVEVTDLHVEYASRGRGNKKSPVRAVDGVSFDIARGEILALVGESGCGKSTIAQAIMRLVTPTSGQILSSGVDLAKHRGRRLAGARKSFQMIFQDPFGSLDPRQTVFETVVEPLIIHGVGADAEDRRARVYEALDFAHLRPQDRLADRYPLELSGGQRHRVAIASAVVLRPDLVVADEPVSMLDVSARAGILSLMVDLRDQLDISYLFITHDLSVAWVIADRIAVVYLGRIIEIGPSTQVVDSPAHPYTRALLDVTTEEEHVVLEGETPSASAIPTGCRFHPRCPLYRELGEPEQCRTSDPALHLIPHEEEAGPRHHSACHFSEEVR